MDTRNPFLLKYLAANNYDNLIIHKTNKLRSKLENAGENPRLFYFYLSFCNNLLGSGHLESETKARAGRGLCVRMRHESM